MKKYIVFLILLPVLLSCEKESDNLIFREDLYGLWECTDDDKDTLYIDFGLIKLKDSLVYLSYYHYKLEGDSIALRYFGLNEVGPFEGKCQIRFLNKKKEYLGMYNFSKIYGSFSGNEFRKITEE
jgi:hypothetical protein